MTSPSGLVVAIDGPSGTGKSTISKRVAADLGLAYLDTGAMYRALTWWCLHQGIDLTDTDAVAAQARAMPLRIGTDPAHPAFAVGDHDVTTRIRTSEISTRVSAVATNLAVRAELQERQRAVIAAEGRPGGFSQGRGIVAEGRDITTVVAPRAQVRILLLADEHARLARRTNELHGRVDAEAIEATRDQVLRRDAEDGTVSNFSTAAPGVIPVDTSQMSLDEAVAAVRDLVEATR
ncbi:(d)CMP kinase [Pseudactinotalea sp. Z1748]|uniref:(d)CMP kinase n=1 Tax=Pseudactinotalea sp. Z1748 TaxID=3413027 RepID=UPI003C7C10ED